MKTSFICLIQLLLLINSSFSQSEYIKYFHRIYDIEDSVSLSSVTETPNGNYLISGRKFYSYINDTTDNSIAYFHEIDRTGNLLWETFFDVPGWSEEICKAVKSANNDIYFLINVYRDYGTPHGWIPFIVKTDSLRNIIWVKKLFYSNSNDIICHDIKIYEYGVVLGGQTDNKPFFIKINEAGNQEYSYRFPSYNGQIKDVFKIAEDEYVLCGANFFAKILADTISSVKNIIMGATEFAKNNNNDIYAATIFWTQNQDWFPGIIKLDESGNVIWSKYYKSSWDVGETFGIATIKDDVYLLIEPEFGYVNGVWQGSKAGIMKFNSMGDLLSTKIFEWEHWSFPKDIISTKENQLLVQYQTSIIDSLSNHYSVLKMDVNDVSKCLDDTLLQTQELLLDIETLFNYTALDTINFLADAEVIQIQDSVWSFLFCIDSILHKTYFYDTISSTLNLNEENLELPNIITPNNDNLNDGLLIDVETPVHFYVYNRWGSQIYYETSKHIYWIGIETNGIKVSDGVYYYILSDDINVILKKGFVTVISGQ